MNNYKYIAIDAQYYLRRQWSVVKYNEGFNEKILLDSFLWVILKIIKNFPADKILLLWDKRPYKKETIIKEYKKNRYRSDEEIEKLTNLISEETDEQKLRELNSQLEAEKYEQELFYKMGMTKYTLLSVFNKFGLVSINEPGYEADDLARLLSILSNERKEKLLLVSRDSDWICMANEYTDVLYYRNMQENGYILYDKDNNPYKSPFDNIDSFHYYQIDCILNQNHNNIELSPEYRNFSLDQIGSKISNKDIDDIKEFYEYYEALYVDNLIDDIKPRLLRAMLNEGSWNANDWLLYQDENELGVYPYYYVKTINNVDIELYKG